MAAVRKRNESSVIDQIGDDLLSWVSTILRLKLYFPPFKHLPILNTFQDDWCGRRKMYCAQRNWSIAQNCFIEKKKKKDFGNWLLPSASHLLTCHMSKKMVISSFYVIENGFLAKLSSSTSKSYIPPWDPQRQKLKYGTELLCPQEQEVLTKQKLVDYMEAHSSVNVASDDGLNVSDISASQYRVRYIRYEIATYSVSWPPCLKCLYGG